MRKFRLLLTVVALCSAPVFLNSCKKDKCKDVTCENGGTCDDGKCNCVEGTEGDKCQTILPNISGTWKVTHMENGGLKYPVNDNAMTFAFNSCAAGNTCGATWTIIESSTSGDYKRTQVVDLSYNLAKDGQSVVLTQKSKSDTEVEDGVTTIKNETCSGNCTETVKTTGISGKSSSSIVLNFEKDGYKFYLTKK